MMNRIQEGLNDRQKELQEVKGIVARKAQKLSTYSSISKVVIVILGALAATKGTADQILEASGDLTSIIYASIGVFVAAIAGLEAAFKFESRAEKLRALATDCQSSLREADSIWYKQVEGSPLEKQLDAAKAIMELQDARLIEIQEKASSLGVNIPLKLRELLGEDDLYPKP